MYLQGIVHPVRNASNRDPWGWRVPWSATPLFRQDGWLCYSIVSPRWMAMLHHCFAKMDGYATPLFRQDGWLCYTIVSPRWMAMLHHCFAHVDGYATVGASKPSFFQKTMFHFLLYLFAEESAIEDHFLFVHIYKGLIRMLKPTQISRIHSLSWTLVTRPPLHFQCGFYASVQNATGRAFLSKI